MNQTTTQNQHSPQWIEIMELMKETDRRMKETDRQMKETDRLMKETDRLMKETDEEIKRMMKETDRRMKDLNTRFISQSGHIIEGLMEPSAIKIFQDRGYNINRCWKNFKKHTKDSGRRLEVDLLLLDDEIAIIVEVKINCTCKEIDHFIDQMQYFKEVCPEYADKEILLSIAAIGFERDADLYAHKRGLFVIRVSNDNIFTLDPNEGDVMLKY